MQLDNAKQQNNPLNNAMQNQTANQTPQQGISQPIHNQPQMNPQQQWNFNQMPTTSAQNPTTTSQPQSQQFFNQAAAVGQPSKLT